MTSPKLIILDKSRAPVEKRDDPFGSKSRRLTPSQCKTPRRTTHC